MKVWCDAVDGAGGKTAGTYSEIGTVTVKKIEGGDPVILGVIASVAPTALTAGESGVAILRIFSKDLGISNENFVLGKTTTLDPVATNNKEFPYEAEFIPLNYPALADAKVTFSLTSLATMTADWDAAIGLVFAENPPDQDFKLELMTQMIGPSKGGDEAKSAAGIKANTYTAFTETIAIPAYAKELVGILSHLIPNAPTAGESAVGISKLECSSITDFQPQEWPWCIANGPSLGTPVGLGPSAPAWYWPTRFDLPGVNLAISVSQILAVALTNEGDGIAAAKFR